MNAFDGEQFYFTNSDISYEQKRGSTPAEPLTLDRMHGPHWRQRTSDWLLIEFTPSLLQLKELNLKCKTIITQPLIEYESAQIVSLATSPFIQATQEQLSGPNANNPRPSMYKVREVYQRKSAGSLGGARYQSSAGANNQDHGQVMATGGQQRQWKNVIRVRQSQSHSARSQLDLCLLSASLLAGLLAGMLRAQLAAC